MINNRSLRAQVGLQSYHFGVVYTVITIHKSYRRYNVLDERPIIDNVYFPQRLQMLALTYLQKDKWIIYVIHYLISLCTAQSDFESKGDKVFIFRCWDQGSGSIVSATNPPADRMYLHQPTELLSNREWISNRKETKCLPLIWSHQDCKPGIWPTAKRDNS